MPRPLGYPRQMASRARVATTSRLLGVAVAVICVGLGAQLLASHGEEARLQRANQLGLEGDYARALATARQIPDGPARSGADVVRAYAHRARGENAAAAAAFSRALRRRPNDWTLQRDYASVLLGLGRRAKAQARMRQALRLNPKMMLPAGFAPAAR